jgi:DnaJ-class molecular chaperone
MLRRDREYICVECQGDGKQCVERLDVCRSCNGNGLYYQEGYLRKCNVCDNTGYIGVTVLEPCKYCRGTGTRMWIDFIKRPSKKEKELNLCLG